MTFDLSVFDEPVQFVRMGALHGDQLHLRYIGDTDATVIDLAEDEARLLRLLDPITSKHNYRPAEKETMLDLVERDIVRILVPGGGLGAYNWALDISEDLQVVRNPFDGGFFSIAGARSFNLVDLGKPLLDYLGGDRTLGDACDAVQQKILSADNGRQVLQDAAKSGRPFYLQLCDAGMSLTKGLIETGAGTCIPARRPVEEAVAA